MQFRTQESKPHQVEYNSNIIAKCRKYKKTGFATILSLSYVASSTWNIPVYSP